MDRLRAMAVFARVVACGSMSAAARELGTTPSAVSQTVRALERDAGVALLLRSTRRLAPTAAGRAFHEGCAQMLAAAERAEQALAQQRDAAVGELRVAAPAGFASEYLGPALVPLLRANPRLSLRVEAGDDRTDLVASRIDIAIRVGRLADSTLVARPLATWPVVVCAAPSWIARAGAPADPRELERADWLLHDALGSPQTVEFVRGRERRAIRVRGRVVANDQGTLAHLAREGMGVARQVNPLVAADLAAGRLVRLLPQWSVAPVGVWAVTQQRHRLPAKVRQALSALREYLASRSDGAG